MRLPPWLLLVFCLWMPCYATASETLDALECTLIADAVTGRVIHRNGVCHQQFSPCSSFKLPLALIGFDSGILESPHSPSWELKPEFNPSQRDLSYPRVDPALWERDSVVWFSQQLTTRLGEAQFSVYVKKLGYGNQNVSGDPGKHNGLTHAWLMSSLAISPDEQIQFLLNFMAHRLPVSEKAYEMTLATIPEYAAAGGWTVHGKSGSGWLRNQDGQINENRPQGWFVGWAEKDGRQIVFARLKVGNTKSEIPGGTKARDEILAEIHALAGNQ